MQILPSSHAATARLAPQGQTNSSGSAALRSVHRSLAHTCTYTTTTVTETPHHSQSPNTRPESGFSRPPSAAPARTTTSIHLLEWYSHLESAGGGVPCGLAAGAAAAATAARGGVLLLPSIEQAMNFSFCRRTIDLRGASGVQ